MTLKSLINRLIPFLLAYDDVEAGQQVLINERLKVRIGKKEWEVGPFPAKRLK